MTGEWPPGSAARGLDLRGGLFVGLFVAILGLVCFGLAEALDVGILVDPVGHMGGRASAAAFGVGLLVADIVLPVPSSLVMLGHGGLFGVLPGALLSLVGRTGNALVGVLLGRAAAKATRHCAPQPSGRAEAIVRRWGLAAVVFTRPLPVVSESTVVAAGAMGMSVPGVVGAAALGALPEALLYAVAGAMAASFVSGAVVFTATIALSGAWAMSARGDRRAVAEAVQGAHPDR